MKHDIDKIKDPSNFEFDYEYLKIKKDAET